MQNGGQIIEGTTLGIRKALIISVSDYANDLQALDFCKKDGEEIYNTLKSIGYQIPDTHRLVGQVKYETMKDAIYDFFTDTNTKAEDVLLFYYSGHGVPDVNGDVFLSSSEINPDAPFRKGFSFYELTNTIERSNSTRIVTILDCCYSGAAKISKGHEEDAAKLGTAAIDDKSRRLQQQGEGKCLLAASLGYQEAYGLKEKGHSIFTYYLLEGFKGNKKAADEEGNITPDTLGKYVYREIVNLPEAKRPKQKPIRKVEAGGDIILASYPELVKKEQIQDPYELIQDATEYLKKGDYNNAIQYSDKAIIINPRIALAYNIKGQALFNLKRYDEALVCYDKALELRPKYLEALNNRALTFATIGKYDEAIESFNQSTDLNPNDATVWNSKGLAFNTLGKYNEAIECFDKAIGLNPSYIEALNNEHIAVSNLRKQQQREQKQIQPSQIGSSLTITSSNIDNTTAYDAKDAETPIKESTSNLTKETPSSFESQSIKDKAMEDIPKPKKNIQSSPIFASLTKDIYHPPPVTEKPRTQETTGQMPKKSVENIPQVIEKKNMLPRTPIGHTDVSQSTEDASPIIKGKGKEYHPTVGKPTQQKNLKLLIPIIIGVAVIGSVIAFAVLSTTTTPPPETTTTTPPPETTTTTPPPSATEQPYSFVRSWGSEGSENGQFQGPYGIAIDSSGNVYVTDRYNHRIQKFTADGTFITAWGSEGKGNADYIPDGIAVDSQNNVYVADFVGNRIQKFTADGTFITAWGSNGTGNGQFDGPEDIAVDSQNNVYVTEWHNHRIQKFTADGTFITKWGSYGTGNGQFNEPVGIAIDSFDNVYVTDNNNNRIQKFTADGTFITKWGSEGSENGQFNTPSGVAIDSQNNVYVTEWLYNDRIQKFTADGTFITAWGSNGTGNGQFKFPSGVAIDSSSGNVYVLDTGNSRVQVFTPGT